MKILQGYVGNRTKEITLAAVFAAFYVITRQIKIDVFPTVSIRICGVFAYIPAMFLPWMFTWIVPFIVSFTSVEPVGSFFALSVGVQVAYFSSRLLKRYNVLSLLFATYAANLTGCTVRVLMGVIPLGVSFPIYMFKATVMAAACLVLAPPILRSFKSLGIINFKRRSEW